MTQLKNNAERSRNILILFYISIGFTILSFIHSYQENSLLEKVLLNDYEDSQLELNDTIGMVVGLSAVAIKIAAVVFFILWFRRAYYNLHQVQGAFPSFEEGWASGSWFVPFLNLVRPFQIMRDVWTDTFRLSKDENASLPGISLLGVWWGAWIVRNVVGRYSFQMARKAETAEDLIFANQSTMWSLCFDMIALVLIILIIKKLQAPEKVLYEKYHERDVSEHLILQ